MNKNVSVDAHRSDSLLQWLEEHQEIESLRAAVCDLNGILRGKRIPVSQVKRVLDGDIRMPLSAVSVDVWGEDINAYPHLYMSGDADGVCAPTGRGPLPVNWTSRPSALVPLWMFEEGGAPFFVDPRQALAAVLDRYDALGLRPVVATELEFYLVDMQTNEPKPPVSPYTGQRLDSDALLSIDELDDFGDFFWDVYAECEQQGVPADSATAENGVGQFEINLLHVDDALKAADDAILFKRIVRGVARKHGLVATFMAKPYGARSGNGMHIHFSLLDNDGNNVFDNGTREGSPVMHNAVAGMLEAMAETTLLFAPHANSYRRLRPDTHAPTSASWGYENRTTAIRIPGGASEARRIEHRVAGADANPYLAMAAVLGAALEGIENGLQPPDPFTGHAYSGRLPKLPADWASAVNVFEDGTMVPRIFDPRLQTILVACKRQEIAGFAVIVTNLEVSTYLEVV